MSPLTDKQKLRILKHIVRGLREVLEEEGVDSSACLSGTPNLTDKEAGWVLSEYRANRL